MFIMNFLIYEIGRPLQLIRYTPNFVMVYADLLQRMEESTMEGDRVGPVRNLLRTGEALGTHSIFQTI